jgi:uncharacterized membrane protein HdeD (DUF308 family)
MLKSLSTSLILRGILALGIGIAALAWPGVTVLALVMLFAVLAFLDAAQQLLQAFSSAKGKRVIGHLACGLVDLVAGGVALAWPAPTALVLVLIIASWAIAGGLFEFFAGFRAGELPGTRAMYLLGGLVSIAFGVALFARPDIGAVTLALVFGLFNLIYGVWQLTLGIEVRKTAKSVKTTVREPQLV